MAGNHMRILAEQIHNEHNTVNPTLFSMASSSRKVTYRLLSRLLGVHVNIAKQFPPARFWFANFVFRMLVEFYQHAKGEGEACHATYVLGGLLDEGSMGVTGGTTTAMRADDGDFLMSSPPVATQGSTRSNGSVSKRVRTILLADENDVHSKFCWSTRVSIRDGS